jgi:hypothetical protein
LGPNTGQTPDKLPQHRHDINPVRPLDHGSGPVLFMGRVTEP